MKGKQKLKTSTLFIALLILSLIFVSVLSFERVKKDINGSEAKDIDGSEAELAVEQEPLVSADPITENRPYWYLLIADKDQQKILFQYIDNCSASDQEKKAMKQSMADIWSRYPDNITEKDYQTLESVDTKVGEYLNDKYGVSTEEGVSRLTLFMFNEGSKNHNILVKIYDENETCIFSKEYLLAQDKHVSSPGILAKHGTYIYKVTLDDNITKTYEFVLKTYYSSTSISIKDSETPISIDVESL